MAIEQACIPTTETRYEIADGMAELVVRDLVRPSRAPERTPVTARGRMIAIGFDGSTGQVMRHGAYQDVAEWSAAIDPWYAAALDVTVAAFPAGPATIGLLNECLAARDGGLLVRPGLERLEAAYRGLSDDAVITRAADAATTAPLRAVTVEKAAAATA